LGDYNRVYHRRAEKTNRRTMPTTVCRSLLMAMAKDGSGYYPKELTYGRPYIYLAAPSSGGRSNLHILF
jgi:hypothetical protein